MTEEFDFSEFDSMLNKDALKEIEEVSKKQSFNNDPLPANTYSMTVEKLELTVTKKGMPAVFCDLKVKEGDFKGRHMFYWMNITTADGKLHPFKVHLTHVFLNSLTGEQIKCSIQDGFETFKKEIQQVFEFARNGYYNMKLTYSTPKNGGGGSFPNLEPIDFNQYVD